MESKEFVDNKRNFIVLLFVFSFLFPLSELIDKNQEQEEITFDISNNVNFESYRPIYNVKRIQQNEAIDGIFGFKSDKRRAVALSIALDTVIDKLSAGLHKLNEISTDLKAIPIDECGAVWESTILISDFFLSSKMSNIQSLILSNSTRVSIINTGLHFCKESKFFLHKDTISLEKMERQLLVNIDEYSAISKEGFDHIISIARKVDELNTLSLNQPPPERKKRISDQIKEKKRKNQVNAPTNNEEIEDTNAPNENNENDIIV